MRHQTWRTDAVETQADARWDGERYVGAPSLARDRQGKAVGGSLWQEPFENTLLHLTSAATYRVPARFQHALCSSRSSRTHASRRQPSTCVAAS
jgi:hypothetical protein